MASQIKPLIKKKKNPAQPSLFNQRMNFELDLGSSIKLFFCTY